MFTCFDIAPKRSLNLNLRHLRYSSSLYFATAFFIVRNSSLSRSILLCFFKTFFVLRKSHLNLNKQTFCSRTISLMKVSRNSSFVSPANVILKSNFVGSMTSSRSRFTSVMRLSLVEDYWKSSEKDMGDDCSSPLEPVSMESNRYLAPYSFCLDTIIFNFINLSFI